MGALIFDNYLNRISVSLVALGTDGCNPTVEYHSGNNIRCNVYLIAGFNI